MTEEQLYNFKDVETLIKECFDKTLKELFPDANTIKPGNWSSYSNELDVQMTSGDIETMEFCLYREPLTKDGKARLDNDEELDTDYAGRLTLQTFFVDGGDVFPVCLDCGINL